MSTFQKNKSIPKYISIGKYVCGSIVGINVSKCIKRKQ